MVVSASAIEAINILCKMTGGGLGLGLGLCLVSSLCVSF